MSNGPFADFQNEVYLNGLLGEQPTLPFGWRETEAAAHAVMTPGAVGYIAGGSGGEETMAANRAAFDRWRQHPDDVCRRGGLGRGVQQPRRAPGVRTGADACKALALGAAAVLLGRPYVYGLALAGRQGCATCCAVCSPTWTCRRGCPVMPAWRSCRATP
jgi:hypothetical protein